MGTLWRSECPSKSQPVAPTASLQMSGNRSGQHWLGVVILDTLHTMSPTLFIPIHVKLHGWWEWGGTGQAQGTVRYSTIAWRRCFISGSPDDF